MARADLDEMRLEISSLAEEAGYALTENEFQNLFFYGEARLSEMLETFTAIAEAEAEEETDDDFVESDWYDDIDDWDYGDDWEIEATISYGEDN